MTTEEKLDKLIKHLDMYWDQDGNIGTTSIGHLEKIWNTEWRKAFGDRLGALANYMGVYFQITKSCPCCGKEHLVAVKKKGVADVS